MTSYKEYTEIAKNSLDAIKSLFILVVVIVLLFFSDIVNLLFDRYNVSQLEFGGIKIDRSEAIKILKQNADRIPQLQGQIEAAKKNLDDLQKRYSEATKALAALKQDRDEAIARLRGTGANLTNLSTPQTLEAVQQVLDGQPSTLQLVGSAQSTLQTASNSTAEAVASLPATRTAAEAQFAIIFGSYRTLEPAKAAIEEAAGRLGHDGVIYIRQGAFRTALQFPNMGAANARLEEARKKLSNQAYVVTLASWCPKPVVEPAGVLNCNL
jgi:uncharacterized protein YlaN (UPF0358 family)